MLKFKCLKPRGVRILIQIQNGLGTRKLKSNFELVDLVGVLLLLKRCIVDPPSQNKFLVLKFRAQLIFNF